MKRQLCFDNNENMLIRSIIADNTSGYLCPREWK